MDVLDNLALGFSVALTLENLGYAFLGCLLGTLVGVLPGIGPIATIAMLLPATFALPPVPALIMLAGIYYGAQYGGSTTAILVNLPGETSSVVTALDGYKMALAGRAGPALVAAAIGSFFAGCVGTLAIAAFSGPLSSLAFKFGPAEYSALLVVGLIGAIALASGPPLKALGMVVLGLLLGLVGSDVNSGVERFSFGLPELSDGIGFVAVAMGIFGYGEVISNLARGNDARIVVSARVDGLMPRAADLRRMFPAILRGTGLGAILGVLPGGGAILASFASYALERRIACKPGEIPVGQGNIRGVAGPESANNAGAQTSFIPLLALGVPGNPVMAMMVGALMIHGIQPGPHVATGNPDLFWGVIASMFVGNAMLLVLNLPLVGVWIRLLTVPYRMLFPGIVLFCAIGVYATNGNVFDIWLVALFGLLGYVFAKLEMEPAPLILGFVLGPLLEENLRRALLISRGDWSVFYTRPISLGLLLLGLGILLLLVLPSLNAARRRVFADT